MPVECALGWPEGLRLLATAGWNPVPALQLALFRHDTVSVEQLLSVGFPISLSSDFRGPNPYWLNLNILQASLCQHCREAGASCPPADKLFCCLPSNGPSTSETALRSKTRRLLVELARNRRAALASLAMLHLPRLALDELGISQDGPMDSNALATYNSLRAFGVDVPRVLYPGTRPLLLSFNIMCRLGGLRLAQALHEQGLCDLNACTDEMTPLASLFLEHVGDEQKEEAICWLLEQGASATFSSAAMMPNFLFYLASVYDAAPIYQARPLISTATLIRPWIGNFREPGKPTGPLLAAPSERKTTPAMIRIAAGYCNPVGRDSCQCPCSSAGCLPLHKFKNGVAVGEAASWDDTELTWMSNRVRWIPKRWSMISEMVLAWIQDCQLDREQTMVYLRDACRLEIFTRLGMAHTCCTFGVETTTSHTTQVDAPKRDKVVVHVPRNQLTCRPLPPFPQRRERDEETRRELEEEDSELRQQLETIIKAYDDALKVHRGAITEFWTWWWAVMQDLLPEIPAEQRQKKYGDYQVKFERAFQSLTQASWEDIHHKDWALRHVYREEELHKMSGIREVQHKDFLVEIKEYFSKILSQTPSGSGRVGKCQADGDDPSKGVET